MRRGAKGEASTAVAGFSLPSPTPRRLRGGSAYPVSERRGRPPRGPRPEPADGFRALASGVRHGTGRGTMAPGAEEGERGANEEATRAAVEYPMFGIFASFGTSRWISHGICDQSL